MKDHNNNKYKMKNNPYDLNINQMKFCENYIKGWTLVDSYCDAYNIQNGNYARVAASNMFAKKKIRQHIEYLQERIEERFLIDREWIITEILDLIEDAKINGIPLKDGEMMIDRKNWLSALSQLSKMLGLDEPNKYEIDVTEFVAKFGEPLDNEKDNDEETE